MRTRLTHALGVSMIGLLAATTSWGSSHREAPGTAGQPKIDSTDFYMFRSYEPGKGANVTFIANYLPLQAPYGGPNYFTLDNNAVYEIHIDNDGDAVEDLTYQFNFDTALANKGKGLTLNINGKAVGIPLRTTVGTVTDHKDPTINESESYSISLITGDRDAGNISPITNGGGGGTTFYKPIDNIGKKTIPNYPAYASNYIYPVQVPGCSGRGRVFVGQRSEAFAVNLGEIFDLVNLVPIEGDSKPGAGDGQGFPGGITQSRDNDELVGKANITSIALELPISCLTGDGNGVIGAWTTASRKQTQKLDASPTYNGTATYNGPLTQVSRLSAPLVNELVIGLKDKDLFNAAEPTQDVALATYVTNPTLPAVLDALFRDAVNSTLGTSFTNIAPTNFPRNDLVTAFLTGFPGLNQLEKVTASEMLRLNTGVAVTPRDTQSTFGVVGGDLAGFPNGRRPGDDTVDIALRVVMGRLCYDLPIGKALGQTDNNVNLGLCKQKDAVVGNVPFTDGAPIHAKELQNKFPYLKDPIPGSPNNMGSANQAAELQ